MIKNLLITIVLSLFLTGWAKACTNFIVTKGASADSSVMIVYTCDGEFHPHLSITPAKDHGPNDFYEIGWGDNIRGKVKQPEHTYKVLGYHHMNEHQVAIAETTFGGRKELRDTTGFISYWTLMKLTLQRAKTAREAVEVMTGIVEEYGYASGGESFSIGDPNEAWIVEMIGTGPHGRPPVWVARKVPDGYISAHANKARIGTFPLDDPENCLYSDNVVNFAVEQGYYDPDSGEPFRFNEAYDPSNPSNLRYCATRVWSIFRRMAPSQEFSPDYHRAVKGAERYPLWIKPDERVELRDAMMVVRDHYEGTEYDMTKGVAAGPYGNPNRWRPLVWEVDGKQCAWERAISTYNTAYSFVAQSRSWLSDEIGGVVWYGLDDTYFTCYTPLYNCMTDIPESFAKGRLQEFDMNSAWWVFNFVSNYANVKYSHIVKDVQQVQDELELTRINNQPAVEDTALMLAKKDKSKMVAYLNDYSVTQAEDMVKRWRELAYHLVTKYNDGYVKNAKGYPQNAGYPESWYRKVMESDSSYKLPVWDKSKEAEEPDNF